MKLKSLPLFAFAAIVAGSSYSQAGFFETFLGKAGRKLDNNFRDCAFNNADPLERAQSDYERLTTPPPPNAKFPVVPFQESDFQTKPWLREFEYVIVVNNSNSILQNENLPAGLPLNLPSLSALGLQDTTDATAAIQNFNAQYKSIADQVYAFGAVQYDVVKGKKVPRPSNIQGAQTMRIYRRGQLIRISKVSTGRNQFEIRAENPSCKTRPAESYYSITEPGYFTFQELMKSGYQSASYDDADMPNAMFYMRNRGIALHEEPEDSLIPLLGRRASGGCTRLDPDTATNLFDRIYATRGTQIPVIGRDGIPVRAANGQLVYKNRETVVFNEGSSRQRESTGPTYSALLIVQPHSVVPTNPDLDRAVSFKFNRQQFSSQGPAPL
jgi:lipoprotein-anchoring transpeptidase ErfK/SrfK